MRDAGYLDLVLETLRLHIPVGVRDELGTDAASMNARLLDVEGDRAAWEADTPVDEQVIRGAKEMRLPVLSDDLDVLGAILDARLRAYTARIMLECLLYRRVIENEAYDAYKRGLSRRMRYTPSLYAAAEELHWEIRKEIG